MKLRRIRSASPKPQSLATRWNRCGAVVQRHASRFDPQPLDRLGRRDTGFGTELPREVARTHECACRQVVDAVSILQMLAYMIEEWIERTERALQGQQRRELRLAARSTVVDDQFLRPGAGTFVAGVLGDHGQSEIDAGGDACAGPQLAGPPWQLNFYPGVIDSLI